MKFPTDQEIETSILWLEANDGDEAPLCKAVALWLEHEKTERTIRNAARSAGVTTATLRRKLTASR